MCADPDAEAIAAPEAEPLIFDAILTPNRSLGPRAFLVMMLGVCAITTGLGVHFFLQGAWPVLGFFGLDVLLLYVAFRMNYRAGRVAERVCVSPSEVVVHRREPSRREAVWRFNPYWLRVETGDPSDESSQVILASHGRRIIVGSFLSPDERHAFADALRAALTEANRADIDRTR